MATESDRLANPVSANTGKASIAIIDSRTLVRGCVAQVLRMEFPELDIVEVTSLSDLCLIRPKMPRLIILRLEPEGLGEIEMEKQLGTLRHEFPDTPIALMSDDDGLNAMQAIRLGCNGYVPTSLSLEIAVAALRLVLVGGVYLPQHQRQLHPHTNGETNGTRRADEERVHHESINLNGSEIARGDGLMPGDLNGHSSDHGPPPPHAGQMPGFTPRELQVIESLQRGRSNKVIAGDLKLSENTIKVHIRHIMRKLKATNRTQAALLSQERWTQLQTLN